MSAALKPSPHSYADLGRPFQWGRAGLDHRRTRGLCSGYIAGGRRERMPPIPRGHRFEIVPDWVCEILSSGITRKDRVVKIPVYARHGVAHLWLTDPMKRTLELSLYDFRVDDEEEPTPEAEGR